MGTEKAPAKRAVKKNPFVILIHKKDWPEGTYQVLPSEPFDKTLFASRGRDAVLEANQIDIAAAVRENGGLRVAIAQFTEVVDFEPSVGYVEKERDTMETVPLEEGTELQDPPEGLGEATSDVELSEDDATSPDSVAEPTEGQALAKEHESGSTGPIDVSTREIDQPDPSPGSTGEHEDPPVPAAPTDAPEPTESAPAASPEEAESSDGGTSVDGDSTDPTQDGFWLDTPDTPPAEETEPPVASPEAPPPPPPQTGKSAADLML